MANMIIITFKQTGRFSFTELQKQTKSATGRTSATIITRGATYLFTVLLSVIPKRTERRTVAARCYMTLSDHARDFFFWRVVISNPKFGSENG
jgi:hypothetical protein